jgi:hypothetical protein
MVHQSNIQSFNSLSTFSTLSINNLKATSTEIFNKTNFTNLYVSGASTLSSSLNVSGNTTLNNATTINSSLNVVGNIIGSGTALTNLNYNAILNPPSIISFNYPSTFVSSLNISGNTTLNHATTISSSLNVVGDINTSGSSVFGTNSSLSTKQNNFTFYYPLLNSSNVISLKYDNTKLNHRRQPVRARPTGIWR